MSTISHLYSHGEGLDLVCELDYSPAELNPPWPAQAILLRAKVGGVDIMPLLDIDIIADIEEAAVWSQC